MYLYKAWPCVCGNIRMWNAVHTHRKAKLNLFSKRMYMYLYFLYSLSVVGLLVLVHVLGLTFCCRPSCTGRFPASCTCSACRSSYGLESAKHILELTSCYIWRISSKRNRPLRHKTWCTWTTPATLTTELEGFWHSSSEPWSDVIYHLVISFGDLRLYGILWL